MPRNWTFNEYDRSAVQQQLPLLPERLYDIHAHIYPVSGLNLAKPNLWSEGPRDVTIQVWREHLTRIVPERDLVGGLFFPAPIPTANIRQENEFLIAQLELNPLSRGLLLVTPDDTPEELAAFLDHPQIAGFKPYHVYSREKPTAQSSMEGFCPEWMWREAHARHGIIMMHMVKDKAIADPDNQAEIRKMCERYPQAKLILAHCARSFHAPHAEEGIRSLRGLENVWFDMSGVCETAAIRAILRQFGPRKLMWGSDFPVSEIRGRCVTVGDGFVWLDSSLCDWDSYTMANPILVGIESMRALLGAIDELGLNAADKDDIFYGNAARMLGLEPVSGNMTQDLYAHAKTRIPGGVQLLSKRPENMAPGQWPAYYREARGCEVWDLDGKHYYDMSTNAVGSCLLGYRDEDVAKAVIRRVELGSMCSLNAPEEVELADLLCEIHPWAEQVRFVRGGGEACATAVRIARATTDRSVIAVCGYHGWQDWYLAANLGDSDALRGHLLPGLDPLGVPRELRHTTVTFRYNDKASLEAVMDQYGSQLAAVIMEPCRNGDPEPGFLEFVRESTRRNGALLIFDEITVGWRLDYGGAHLRFGVTPDIAVFAKAMGNGHPIGAIIGTQGAMEGAHGSFISSTYWTESVGPAAALATLRKLGQLDVPAHVERIGRQVLEGWRLAGEKYRLPVSTGGYPALAHFSFQHPESEKLRTLYTQLMLERGYLAGTAIYPTVAHTDEIVRAYGNAVDEVFGDLAETLQQGTLDRSLKGGVALSGFARLI